MWLMMIVEYISMMNEHTIQQYGDATLVKDCIDELVAMNGSHDDKIKIKIVWDCE